MLPHTEFFQLSETAMHRASVPSSRAAYPSYTGMFSDPGYGDISVNLFGDGLHISYYQHSWPLRLSADTFYFCMRAFGTDFKVPVVFNETNGVIDSLSIPFQPQMPIRFIKR